MTLMEIGNASEQITKQAGVVKENTGLGEVKSAYVNLRGSAVVSACVEWVRDDCLWLYATSPYFKDH